jgi:hypothetical protein
MEEGREDKEETNLKTPIAEAPYADVAHTLIEPDDRSCRASQLYGPDGCLRGEVLAHILPEFRPQDTILPGVDLGHGDFLQTAIVLLDEESEWGGFESGFAVICSKVNVPFFDNSVCEWPFVGLIKDDTDAAVG